jgi:hypothetical protein
MARLQPMRAASGLALAGDIAGPAAQAVLADFRGRHAGDNQRGMRIGARNASRHSARRGGCGAAIDDQPLLRPGEFKPQRARMGKPVQPGRLPAPGIDEQQRLRGGNPLKVRYPRAPPRRPAPARPAPAPDRSGYPNLPCAVEQSEPAIAMPQRPHGRRRPLDRAQQLHGRLCPGRLQKRADFGQILQRRQMRCWAALDMAAIGIKLPPDFGREKLHQARARCPTWSGIATLARR